MLPDHRARLDESAWAVGESLVQAWAHFHLLRGLDNGRRTHPHMIDAFGLLYDRMWRSAFDALFAKVGTVLDSNRGNHSLIRFLQLARRYADSEVKQFLPTIEVDLTEENSSLARLRRWRHQAVAHKPAAHDVADFHVHNKMTLTEIEEALDQLDRYFNQISWNVLGLHSEHRSAFEAIVGQAEQLFTSATVGLAKESE